MGHTHVLIGGAAWLGVAAASKTGHVPMGAAAVFGGWGLASIMALVPDIDTPGSIISRSLGPVTQGISWVVRTVGGGHRCLTHSLLGILLVSSVFGAMEQGWHIFPWVVAAALIGYVSHVLADMMTRAGCPLFWPFSDKKFGPRFMTTDKKAEHCLVLPASVLTTVVLLYLSLKG